MVPLLLLSSSVAFQGGVTPGPSSVGTHSGGGNDAHSSSYGGERAPRSSSAPLGIGSVSSTLDLLHGSLQAGNSPPPNTCFDPTDLVEVSSLNELFVTCSGPNNNVVDVALTTGDVLASVPVGQSPSGIDYDAATGDLYVANAGSNNLTVLDAATDAPIASVPVDLTPEGVAFDASNSEVYVADEFSNNLSVVAAASNTVLTSFTVGSYPTGVAYDSTDQEVFVANRGSDNVSIISTATNAVVANVAVGYHPDAVCFDSGNDQVYVANSGDDNVSVLDAATGAVVSNVAVGASPRGIACDVADAEVYVANEGSNNLTVISAATGLTVANPSTPAQPWGVAMDTTSDEVMVADPATDQASIFDGATSTLAGTLELGFSPQSVAYDASNGDLYVANAVANNLTVVDGTSNTVVTSVAVGVDPTGVAFDSANGDLYVANAGSGSVTVVDGATNAVVTTLVVGFDPVAVGVDPNLDTVYVANAYSNSVTLVDGATNAVTKTVDVGAYPSAVAVDPNAGEVYVANAGSDNVSVLAAATGALTATVQLAANPSGAVFDEGSGNIYVSEAVPHIVSIISGVNQTLLGSIRVPVDPTGLGYVSTDGDILAADTAENELSVLSGFALLGNLTVGTSPTSVAFDGGNGFAYATDSGDSAVTILTPSATIPSLASVSVVPSPAVVALGESAQFVALPVCAGGGCPSGAAYTWTLNNSLGTLASPSGPWITFTAGATVGWANLSLTETLNSVVSSRWSDIEVAPDLASIVISPSPTTVSLGGVVDFTATPTCSPSPCPGPKIGYAWSLNTLWGNLSSSTSNPAVFTAGSRLGTTNLFVNADLGGSLGQASAVITLAPAVMSLTLSPSTAVVPIHAEVNVTATPQCSGGSCPAGATYAWSVNNSLGTLAPTSGATATFTAGAEEGLVTLSVVASLDGVSARGSVPLALDPILATVDLNPSSFQVVPGGLVNLTASPLCIGGPCPAGTTYAWSVSGSLGTMAPGTGPTNAFTAGTEAGNGAVVVQASLNGRMVSTTSPLSVSTTLPSLVQVTLSPSVAVLQPNLTLTFNATPTCSPSPCALSDLAYAWHTGSSLASVLPTIGPEATLVAGSTPGQVGLTVRANLYGIVQTTTAVVTIQKGAVPRLTGVALLAGASVNGNQNFVAEASCSPGPCPSEVTYAWSLNSTLGTLSSLTGTSTSFTPGPKGGTVQLEVTATLDDWNAGNSTDLQVFSPTPPLVSAEVTPPGSTVAPGATISFSASAVCAPNPTCPSTLTWNWSLNAAFGTLSSMHGSSITFTAGNATGTVTLTATASLGGTTVGDAVVITISSPGGPAPTFLGLPAVEGYALLGAGLLVIVLLLLYRLPDFRRRPPTKPSTSSRPSEGRESEAAPRPDGARAEEEVAPGGPAGPSSPVVQE